MRGLWLSALAVLWSLVMPLVSSESSSRPGLQSRRLRPRSGGPAPTPDDEAILARHNAINRKVQLALENKDFRQKIEYCLQMISDFGSESEAKGWAHLNLDNWNRCIDMMDLDPRQKFDPLFLENLKHEIIDHMRRNRRWRYNNDDDTYNRPLYFSNNAKPDSASVADKARKANPFTLSNIMKVLKSTQWPTGPPMPKPGGLGQPMLMRPG